MEVTTGPTQARLDPRYLVRTLYDLKLGEQALVAVTQMVVDEDLSCWIALTAQLWESPDQACLLVRKVPTGFEVDFQFCRNVQWYITERGNFGAHPNFAPVVQIHYR